MSVYLLRLFLGSLCSRKCSLCFCALSVCLFLFRLGLVVVTVSDPCEYYSNRARQQQQGTLATQPFSVCLSNTEIFFRFLLTCVTGVIIAGHFMALLLEDRILIGMVIGAEWLNVSSELISKSHAVLPLLGDFDVSTFIMTFSFFIVEFFTALSLLLWVCRVRCTQRRQERSQRNSETSSPARIRDGRHSSTPRRRHFTAEDVDDIDASEDDGGERRSLSQPAKLRSARRFTTKQTVETYCAESGEGNGEL